MPDDTPEDHGNEAPLEGAEEIFSAIDQVLDAPRQDKAGGDGGQQQDDGQQQHDQGGETPEAKAERERNEQGQFVAKQKQEEKDRQEAQAKNGNNGQNGDQKPGEKQYPAEIKSPKAREHFDALSKVKEDAIRRAEAAENRVKEFETKVQQLEARSGVAAPEVKVLQKQLGELQAKLDEREQVIAYTAVQETTPFKEGVTQPQKEAEEDMNQIAETYKLDARKLDEILRHPNKFQRAEMLADLTADLPERSAYAKADLRAAVEKWVGAEGVAKKLFADAKGNRDFAEQEKMQTDAQAALQRQQQFKTAEKDVLSTITPKFPELSSDKTMWDSINEKAAKVSDFSKLPPKAQAYANWTSWAFMPLMEKHRAVLAELQKEKEINAARTKSMPGGGGARGGVQLGKDEAEVDENDPLKGLFGGIDSVMQR